ncbi:ABC transporter ATP-binding protein [Aquabacter cavernae]|uniref:ABC transporter ATP-binding protein n=1 Tax=Aquabacter cavernae TaxID=2496029 RepID=UPI000F8DC040|nr:ABC transporter ATP-binding protein [Aquabacter cavernae]
MSAGIVLQAKGLTKEFRGFKAVDDVDLSVERGSIHALIGPNGAGKTTCFNLLTRFLPLTRGSILFNGRDISALSAAHVARLGLVRSFQISSTFPQLSCIENVAIALQARGGNSFNFWSSERRLDGDLPRARELVDMVGLGAFADVAAGDLPYGRKRALEIATTLALEPEVMLLDEPMAGMAHGDIDQIVALIQKIRVGRTILMVEHNLHVVAELSDRITVLTRGQVLVEGSYQEISRHPAVIEAYMGGVDA